MMLPSIRLSDIKEMFDFEILVALQEIRKQLGISLIGEEKMQLAKVVGENKLYGIRFCLRYVVH